MIFIPILILASTSTKLSSIGATLWTYLRKWLERNKKLKRFATGSIANLENIDSRLGESVDGLYKSKKVIHVKEFEEKSNFNSSAEVEKSSSSVIVHGSINSDPSEIDEFDLSIKHVTCFREELAERDIQLRKDMQAQFEEIKKYLNSNEEKHYARYKETKERLDRYEKKRKDKIQHQEARQRLGII